MSSRSAKTMDKNDSDFRNLQDLEEEESKKIECVKQIVATKDPTYKEEDDLTIRRFLRARDLDVWKASAMFLRYLKWKKEFLPRGSIFPSQVQNELAQNKIFLQGFDKQGRPIAVVRGSKHFRTEGEEFKRFIVYILEKVCERMPPGQEKLVFIVDVEGWGYANSDLRGHIDSLNILQNYYPERLGKVFMLHVPYVFSVIWKLTCPFIDANTRKKITFVDNKELTSKLLEDIDVSQLPELYGGQLPLIPIEKA